jgi:hypothetical protein
VIDIMGCVELKPAHEGDIDELSSLVVNKFREEQKHVPILQSCFERDMTFLERDYWEVIHPMPLPAKRGT